MHRKILIILLSSLFSYSAMAELADKTKPIELSADKGSVDQAQGITQWQGNVEVKQGTLQLNANTVIVTQDKQGNQTLESTGSPSKFRQKIEGKNEFIEGEAAKIQYSSHLNLVTLTGKAWIKRGSDQVRGEVITYNTSTEVYEVKGSAKGSGTSSRVTVILFPKTEVAPTPKTSVKPSSSNTKKPSTSSSTSTKVSP